MKTATIYIAFDDARFDSAEECRAYEAAHVETRLVGLTIDQVRAALSRDDVELADALEEIGGRIARARRDAGELRRSRKPAPEPDAKPTEGEAAKPGPDAGKLEEALQRARAAGLMAWQEKRGAVVPDAWAAAKPLHEAWLDGWREGQIASSRQADSGANDPSYATEDA